MMLCYIVAAAVALGVRLRTRGSHETRLRRFRIRYRNLMKHDCLIVWGLMLIQNPVLDHFCINPKPVTMIVGIGTTTM